MENLTAETFKEKVFDYSQNEEWSFNGEKPAIIDFYADWCGPCKVVGPILEELDGEYDGVDFYKVNTEEEPELSMTFGIQSIPALLFIPMGAQPQMALGALPKPNLEQVIAEVLKVTKE
jgi:thioredoxin